MPCNLIDSIFCVIYVLSRGVDLHPPSGFVNLLNKNASNPTQDVNNGSSSQPINICDDTDYSSRTEKRLVWTKEEDLILVSNFLLGVMPFGCFICSTI
jgi:hypothetical protein